MHLYLNFSRQFPNLETVYCILMQTHDHLTHFASFTAPGWNWNVNKTGAPLDKITVTIYKKMKQFLSPTIFELFNLTLRVGIFPKCLKVGRVIPIFKSGKKGQLKNYKPTTILVVSAKGFEKLMHKWMVDFINKFNIINSNQFGFIPDHKTSDALLEFLDNAYEAMNKNIVLLAIFLDFSKA